MGQKQEARTLYHISCACGGIASMDARSFGRPQVCKKCGGSLTVGWAKDPATGKAAPQAVSLARKRPPTPLAVVCSCGYRRAVTAAEAAGHNRCPGCGRAMIVEKPPAPKGRENPLARAAPLPPPPLPPAPWAAAAEPQVVEVPEGAQAFNCVCGERLLIRSQAAGTVIDCPACDRKLRVQMKRAPSSSSMPAVAGPTLPGGKTPTPLPAPFARAELTCECGQSLELLKAFEAQGTVCPSCGRTITMEKIRAPQSKHTVIRPRFAPKTPPPEASPAAPAEAEALFELPEAPAEPAPASPARTAASTFQEVFCPCGEALTVGSEEVGRNMQCPTCLTLMAVDQIRDPKSGGYVIRVRAIGRMDQDTWSLNDFS